MTNLEEELIRERIKDLRSKKGAEAKTKGLLFLLILFFANITVCGILKSLFDLDFTSVITIFSAHLLIFFFYLLVNFESLCKIGQEEEDTFIEDNINHDRKP